MDKEFLKLLLITVFLIIFSFGIAYKVHMYTKKDEKRKSLSFIDWFNQGKITMIGLLVSTIFGLVFGFLDNFFLWMGIDKMMSFIPGGTYTKAAWGNTYSDFVGATVGAAISSIGKDLVTYDADPPIWINAISIPLGCIMGMKMGRFIFGGR